MLGDLGRHQTDGVHVFVRFVEGFVPVISHLQNKCVMSAQRSRAGDVRSVIFSSNRHTIGVAMCSILRRKLSWLEGECGGGGGERAFHRDDKVTRA